MKTMNKNKVLSKFKKLAAEYLSGLEKKTRDNGDEFWCIKDGYKKEEELRNLLFKAHEESSNLLPNDWSYAFVKDSLGWCSDCEDLEEYQDIADSIEPDIYTFELTRWLNSNCSRVYYITEALQAGFGFDDGFKLLSYAQQIEKREVFESVWNYLESEAQK